MLYRSEMIEIITYPSALRRPRGCCSPEKRGGGLGGRRPTDCSVAYLVSSTTSASMTSSLLALLVLPLSPVGVPVGPPPAFAPAFWYITSASLCEALVSVSVAFFRLSRPPCSIALRASLMALLCECTWPPEI